MKKPEKSGAAEFSFNRTSSAKIKNIEKKAYVFNLFMLLTVAIVLTTAFIMFSQKYAPLDEKKPAVQLELFKAYAEGEKVQFYLDNAAKYASEDAVYTFADNGGYASPECNAYNGYTLWADRGRECYPTEDDLAKNYADFFSQGMGKYTQNYKSDVVDIVMPTSYDAKFDSVSKDVILKATTDLKIAPKPEAAAEEVPGAVAFSGKLVWPTNIKGISSCYGWRDLNGRQFHDGIDIDTYNQDPIYSVADGVVMKVCQGHCGGYGNSIVIKHTDTFYTRYNHLSKISINQGDVVGSGDEIGRSGSTGDSTGDHLDFKVYYDDDFGGDVNKGVRNSLCLFSQMKGSLNLFGDNCQGNAEFTTDCPAQAPAITSVGSTIGGDVILKEAEKMLNVPYVYGGRTEKGVDCIGYLYIVLRKTGFIGDDQKAKNIFSNGWLIYPAYGEPVPSGNTPVTDFDELQPGDLIFFSKTTHVVDPRQSTAAAKSLGYLIGNKDIVEGIHHAGIYVGAEGTKHKFIHASGSPSKPYKVTYGYLEDKKADGENIFATRITGEGATAANPSSQLSQQTTHASPGNKLIVLDVSKANTENNAEAIDFADKIKTNLETSSLSVIVLEKTYDEIQGEADAMTDEFDQKTLLESSSIFADLYIEVYSDNKKATFGFHPDDQGKKAAENFMINLKDNLGNKMPFKAMTADKRKLDVRFMSGNDVKFPVLFVNWVPTSDADKYAKAAADVISKNFQEQGVKLAIKPGGDPTYKQWLATHYYTAYEGDFKDWSTGEQPCPNKKSWCCIPMSKRGFYEDTKCEGSGMGTDGKTVYRYWSSCKTGSCIKTTKAESIPTNKEGRISIAGGDLVMHKTIAVPPELRPDPKNPKTYYLDFTSGCSPDNMQLCEEWSGCYLGQDAGKAITGHHIDLYVGFGLEEYNKASNLPGYVDIWDVECEPGTGSSGGLTNADTSVPVEGGAIDVTGNYEYTLKPATRQNIDYDFRQYVGFAEIAEAANEYMIVCLRKEPTYEDISKCADQFSLMGSPEKIVVEEKERVEGGGGFFVGFTAETPFSAKYHSETPKARFGIVIKDTYPPLMENPFASKTADDEFEISFKGKSVDIQTYKITYAVKGGSSYMLAEFDDEYKAKESPAAKAALEEALLNNEEVCFTMTAIDETDENKATTYIPCQKYGFDSSVGDIEITYKGG